MRKGTTRSYLETYHTLFAKICVISVVYIFFYYSYIGLISPVTPGDSTGYHIPIAKSILDGSFLYPRSPEFMVNPVMFYPGSSEAILSVFILLHIPLNLYNIFALGLLFISCLFLGTRFFRQRSSAVIFATAVISLPLMTQWVITQFVDYWFAVFFVVILFLLQAPRKSLKYIFLLGIASGFLIGTKYSGPFTLAILFFVYYKEIYRIVSLRTVTVFGVVAFVSGGFWYLRNLIFTGNPYFPQNLLATDKDFLKFKVFDSMIEHPYMMFDALLHQYAAWSFVALIVPIVFYVTYAKLDRTVRLSLVKLMIVSLLCFVVFGILPSEPGSYTHYISTYRYSMTMFIPLMLMLFIFAELYKQYVLLYMYVFVTMLTFPQLSHHPKLIFLFLPVTYIIAIYPRLTGRYIQKYL